MSTKHKLEFVYLMAKHSSASLADCQRLLRFAGTLQRINGDVALEPKKQRLLNKVLALCELINVVPSLRDGSLILNVGGRGINVPS